MHPAPKILAWNLPQIHAHQIYRANQCSRSVLLLATTATIVVFLQTEVETQYKSNDTDDEDKDKQSPATQAVAATDMLDTLVQLDMGLLALVDDNFCLLFGLLNLRLLVDDLLVQLLEELGKLDHGLLDALDVVVAGAHGSQNAVGMCGTVLLELLYDDD